MKQWEFLVEGLDLSRRLTRDQLKASPFPPFLSTGIPVSENKLLCLYPSLQLCENKW